MLERQTIVVTFRPEPRVDPVRALRGLLKVALRTFGLKAVEIKIDVTPGGAGTTERDRA